MTILSFFGLMTIKEHEDVRRQAVADRQALRRMEAGRNDWRANAEKAEALFKKAAKNLEDQSREIAVLKAENRDLVHGYAARGDVMADQAEEIASLRHDAKRWRQRLANDRVRRAKRSAGK